MNCDICGADARWESTGHGIGLVLCSDCLSEFEGRAHGSLVEIVASMKRTHADEREDTDPHTTVAEIAAKLKAAEEIGRHISATNERLIGELVQEKRNCEKAQNIVRALHKDQVRLMDELDKVKESRDNWLLVRKELAVQIERGDALCLAVEDYRDVNAATHSGSWARLLAALDAYNKASQ